MEKNPWNGVLLAGVILPLVLLFWPFARWGGVMSLLLRVVPALCLQTLLCRVGRYEVVKVLPLVLTGLLALWGTYLYCTSPSWVNAELSDLLADYCSPFLGCGAAYAVDRLKGRL